MSEKPKGKRDFSDIDNLERATESFMRGQRKALTGSHAGSRAFHTLNLHKLTRFGAVFAVIAVIVGTVVFAGIRFGKQDQDFLKPAETTAASVTAQTDPPAETTLPEETVTTEQPAQPIATLTSSRTQTTAATATTSASAIETDGTWNAAETTGSSAATTATSRTNKPAVVQIPPAAATEAPATAAPVTAPPVTAAQITTVHTNPTTARTTVTTRATTRPTAAVRTTTVTTTTVRTTTTVTTTTEPKVAVITITKLVVDGQTHYSGSCKENVHVTVKNTGNATLSGSYALSIRCVDAENIVHVGCTSGNVLSNITHTGEVMTLYYCGSLAPDAKDTIELTVLTQDPLLVCRAA